MKLLTSFARGLLEICYPRFCQFCGSRECDGATPFICNDCLGSVTFLKPPCCDRCGLPFEGEVIGPADCPHCRGFDWSFEKAIGAVRLRGAALEVLHRFKYQGQTYWRTLLAQWMLQAAGGGALSDCDAIVPVPLFPRRERERQYNQSAILARDFGGRIGLPILKGALTRARDTLTQTRLDREERRANQRGAYRVDAPDRVVGREICLIDDVFTTGATTEECAKTLVRAGAKKVLVLTVARG